MNHAEIYDIKAKREENRMAQRNFAKDLKLHQAAQKEVRCSECLSAGVRQNAMEGKNMEKIGNYSAYGNSIYQQNKTARNVKDSEKTDAKGIDTASKTGDKVNLSTEAKNLLKELKKTYSNMDFIVADYETDEEAAAYLARGTGEFSVLLTPDELEKMAADEDYKKQNLQTLDNALAKLGEMKEQLGESGEAVKRIGIAIGDDGGISYFAELEKTNAKQRDCIEKQRENRREEKAEAEKKAEREKAEESADVVNRAFGQKKYKRTVVYADSVEELSEKIKQLDWNQVREQNDTPAGSHFDFTA